MQFKGTDVIMEGLLLDRILYLILLIMSDILAIHDLSSYGKSSLSVVIPVLESLGSECSSLPTALLSTQSDGFEPLYMQDLTNAMRSIFSMHKSINLHFDAVYSGFLGSSEQIYTVEEIIKHYNTFTLVDPVLGDNGKLYQTMEDNAVDNMRRLVHLASLITPNYTEAGLLTGLEYSDSLSNHDIENLVGNMRTLGPESGVITSVPIKMGLANIAYDRDCHRVFMFADAGISYPGSGDLFASILLALIMKKMSFFAAVKTATEIASYAISESKRKDRERRRGVMLSPVFEEIKRRAL